MTGDLKKDLLVLPLKANTTALAGFFAIMSGAFGNVERNWLVLLPGWLFLLGVLCGFLVLSIVGRVDSHFLNLDTILGNEKIIDEVDRNPSPTNRMRAIRAQCSDANEKLKLALLSDDFLANHHHSVNIVSNVANFSLFIGISLGLIALSSM